MTRSWLPHSPWVAQKSTPILDKFKAKVDESKKHGESQPR